MYLEHLDVYVLVTSLIVVTKYPTRSNSRAKGFILVYGSKSLSWQGKHGSRSKGLLVTLIRSQQAERETCLRP